MQKIKISENSKHLMRLRALLAIIILSFITGGIFVFSRLAAYIFGGASLVLFLLYFFVYVNLYYRCYSFSINKEEIILIKGVFVKRRICISSGRVQYIEILSSPLQKYYGMCSVMFHTAGAIVLLSNIRRGDVKEIKEVVNEKQP